MTNTKAGTRAKARLTLTFNDLTPLQKQFSRAKAMRRAMQEYLAAETGLLRGYKRMQILCGVLAAVLVLTNAAWFLLTR